MASTVHYEVFRRVGSKGGWALHEAVQDRDGALKLAQGLMDDGQATGVKVIKETYNDDTGEFLTLKIFEDGLNKLKVKSAAEDLPHALPCFKPDDLYSYHARATIARLLGDFLARNRTTVIELIHRADLLEKLEATGTVYQHAVQKIAVAQAASTGVAVQQIVKSLDDLVTKAIQRVYRDEKKGVFASFTRDEIATLAEKLAREPDGAYLLNGVIACRLKPLPNWDAKLAALLGFLADAPAEGAARALLLNATDSIVAEIVGGSPALNSLFKQEDCFGETLLRFVELFLAGAADGDDAQAGVAALAKHFSRDELSASRTALAARILAEIKSAKRLDASSVENELRLLRRIANRLVTGLGKYLAHEDLIAAFTLRSKRLVTPDALAEAVSDLKTPDRKLERLVFIAENIIGVENKRRIAEFVGGLVFAPSFEAFFVADQEPVLTRVNKLAALQVQVLRSGIAETQKVEFANALDRVASNLEARARIFETIAAKATSPVDRALTLLRLCTGGVLTEGQLSARARRAILSCLSQPGFLEGYTERAAKPGEGVVTLMTMLNKAGIPTDVGMKSLAA